MMRSAEKGELYEQPRENPHALAPMPPPEPNKREVSSDTIDRLADELEANEPENQAGIEEIKEDQNG
jgi:hypothetical protein